MGCVFRSTTRAQQKPQIPDLASVQARDKRSKKKQKKDFDSRHRARELSPLEPGYRVWVSERGSEAEVCEEVAPQSYVIELKGGPYVETDRTSPDYQTQKLWTPLKSVAGMRKQSNNQSNRMTSHTN